MFLLYFLAAFATFMANVIFPASTEAERDETPHYYGYAYWISWGCVLLYALSAVCLSLDDIVRSSVKRCCAG